MATAALPVAIALGIMSDVQPDSSRGASRTISTAGAGVAPQVAAINTSSGNFTAKADPARAESEPDLQDPPSTLASAPDQRGDGPSADIRLAGVESRTDSATTTAAPFASTESAIVRLETQPPPEDALQRRLLHSDPLSSILKSFWSENTDTLHSEEDTADTRSAAVSSQAKPIRAETKSRGIAHHRHHQKHPLASLFAKIGRSVKGALMNAVTFARGGKERGLWE
jgi:hypothetical protein